VEGDENIQRVGWEVYVFFGEERDAVLVEVLVLGTWEAVDQTSVCEGRSSSEERIYRRCEEGGDDLFQRKWGG